jgi:hypothetical protein
MSTRVQVADHTSPRSASPPGIRHAMLPRVAAAVFAVLLLGALVTAVAAHHEWGAVALGVLGPDLALLLGGGAGLARGQLHPRAVPLYNALHRPAAAALLVALAGLGVLTAWWLVLGLAWLFHISVDRAAGYGLRDARGFQRD